MTMYTSTSITTSTTTCMATKQTTHMKRSTSMDTSTHTSMTRTSTTTTMSTTTSTEDDTSPGLRTSISRPENISFQNPMATAGRQSLQFRVNADHQGLHRSMRGPQKI